MKKPALFVVAFGLTLAAILLFMAGQPRFAFLERSASNFLGTAAILISGLFWILWSTSGRKKPE